MPRSKPIAEGWAVSPPQLSAVADAAGQVLADDEWTGVSASGDYVGQSAIDVEFSDVRVTDGRWSGVTIERWRATDVLFVDCDLSGFVLQEEAWLRRVAFRDCRLSGAVFAGAHLHDVSFEDCRVDDANFRMTTFEKVTFTDCALVGADFYAATLNGVRAADCDLRGITLTKAALSSVDLRTSNLQDVVGADALRGATIDSVQVVALARSLAAALEIDVTDD